MTRGQWELVTFALTGIAIDKEFQPDSNEVYLRDVVQYMTEAIEGLVDEAESAPGDDGERIKKEVTEAAFRLLRRAEELEEYTSKVRH